MSIFFWPVYRVGRLDFVISRKIRFAQVPRLRLEMPLDEVTGVATSLSLAEEPWYDNYSAESRDTVETWFDFYAYRVQAPFSLLPSRPDLWGESAI
jgi:hypothetical protein